MNYRRCCRRPRRRRTANGIFRNKYRCYYFFKENERWARKRGASKYSHDHDVIHCSNSYRITRERIKMSTHARVNCHTIKYKIQKMKFHITRDRKKNNRIHSCTCVYLVCNFDFVYCYSYILNSQQKLRYI